MGNICITTGRGGAGVAEGIGGRGGDVNITHIHGPGSSIPDILRSLPRAQYATHDSGRKHALSSCLEGTRIAVLANIMSWLEGIEGQRRPIYWLSGLAGIGKSTIAKTVADKAEGRGMLGASFFFSRGDEPLRNPQLVFPTLAFQLAQSYDPFKKVIIRALKNDLTLGEKKLLPQLQGLILEPLLKVNPKHQPVLIILDALDECEDSGAAEILRLLFSLATRIPFLRILITSRLEPHICLVFDEELNHAKTVLHDIETSVIQEDIRLYLHTELAKVPRTLNLRMGTNWASKDEIRSLVEKSGKLFIYASTSIRFISDDRIRNPRRQLRLILDLKIAQEAGAAPYMQLDNLYMGVLRNSLSDSNRGDILKRFQLVVGSIVLLREPLPLRSLAEFIPYEMGEIDAALYHLRSIIIPPSNEDDAPQIYHPSFRDFIMDSSRCSDEGFAIVPVPKQERRHAIRCLGLLATFLKRDIAGISNPSLLNKEVDGFDGKVRDALSPEVQYACRYWAMHLSCVELGDEVMVEALERFSMRSILWWFEAMSLIGSVSAAVSSVREAHHWVMKSKCELTLVTILADAHRFVLAHGEVIRASALHVYESALPFTPHETMLYKTYCKEAEHSINVIQGAESQWPRNMCSLHHDSLVTTIAFSPDGLRLASGSSDGIVHLWDVMSAEPIASLNPATTQHQGDNIVTSIAFSRNSLHLASGTESGQIQIWDAISGVPITTLAGHSTLVASIKFSPNGLQLASHSSGGTVQLWHAMSGAPIELLEGHPDKNSCMSFAFWADGLQLALGFKDGTVQVWDAMSGAPVVTLEGHSNQATCIAFSPKGSQVASGSFNGNVQL